eukprot:CAMPEP_0176394838 /NCGR_PEP_ID=MMETSP0126-20121128/42909_1 /TAXON_ID=141414 ORGANISM="Strombidinopsis acuminatum, Strain SPMC142" /NCGR_SAMPLE_ID=MMETSP0126 /ASSEMBLY_ACC=CAM_ASM_000229 /LENGTH=41 /DNA_ID= /DNA_START= /DNA_END= /DNA_ORIENTATION=
MNKARHELETRLQDEIERNSNLVGIIKMKDESLQKKSAETE